MIRLLRRTVCFLCLLPPMVAVGDPASSKDVVTIEPGTIFHYEGRLAPAGSTDAGQAIDAYLMATPAGRAGFEHAGGWLWVTETAGRGGWDWTRSFGLQTPGKTKEGPSIRFDHDSGTYVVRLPRWQWDVYKWKVGTQWELPGKRLVYRVMGREDRGGVSCWKVVARVPIGVKRTLWIDARAGVLHSVHERVFMGRGEKYDLRLELVGASSLDDSATGQAWEVAKSLDELRRRLGKRQDAGSVPWTAQQLERLAAYPLEKDVRWAPLKRLLREVQRDRQTQHRQAGALESLARRVHGQNLMRVTFRDAEGRKLKWDSIAKKVTVLHFWEYRDRPLRPPYGQVGFLDFLSRKHASEDVAVVGVVVHSAGDSDAARKTTVRSATKLSRFMNLSYPLVYDDDGAALSQIGDPRSLGVALPLYLVVDARGRIVSHHFGLYPVDPSRGLQTLSAEIQHALQSSE